MAKKAATDFGTLDPNDEKELRASAEATADKVLQEALNQGFSKEEAEQIANNTFDTMFSGLKICLSNRRSSSSKRVIRERNGSSIIKNDERSIWYN